MPDGAGGAGVGGGGDREMGVVEVGVGGLLVSRWCCCLVGSVWSEALALWTGRSVGVLVSSQHVEVGGGVTVSRGATLQHDDPETTPAHHRYPMTLKRHQHTTVTHDPETTPAHHRYPWPWNDTSTPPFPHDPETTPAHHRYPMTLKRHQHTTVTLWPWNDTSTPPLPHDPETPAHHRYTMTLKRHQHTTVTPYPWNDTNITTTTYHKSLPIRGWGWRWVGGGCYSTSIVSLWLLTKEIKRGLLSMGGEGIRWMNMK